MVTFRAIVFDEPTDKDLTDRIQLYEVHRRIFFWPRD